MTNPFYDESSCLGILLRFLAIIVLIVIFTWCGASIIVDSNDVEKQEVTATITITNKYVDRSFNTTMWFLTKVPTQRKDFYVEYVLDNGYRGTLEVSGIEFDHLYTGKTFEINGTKYGNEVYFDVLYSTLIVWNADHHQWNVKES